MSETRAAAASKEISTGTAARILRLSQDTVTRLCEEGTLEAERTQPRGWWRISMDSVTDLLQRRKLF